MALRRVSWLGSSYRDYIEFPERVQGRMGFSLYLAQIATLPTTRSLSKASAALA